MTKTGRNSSGFTLTELIISMVIAMILISTIITIFFYGRRAYDYSSYSYTVTQDTRDAMEWLRRDLMMTSLSSVRIYPDNENKSEAPGFSMIGAIDFDKDGFTLTSQGAPQWSRHIFYTIKSNDKSDGRSKTGLPETGTLYRWEIKLDDPLPFPVASTVLPSDKKQQLSNQNLRVILRNVVMPGQDLDDDKKTDQYESFRIAFVRKSAKDSGDETLYYLNPCLITDDGKSRKDPDYPDVDLTTATNTELIQVNLTVMEISPSTGKPNYFFISERIKPRN